MQKTVLSYSFILALAAGVAGCDVPPTEAETLGSPAVRKALAAEPATLAAAARVTYFASSSEGSDTNSGLSRSAPFKTLAKVNSLALAPGTHVRFKADDRFNGRLAIRGRGTSADPIVFGRYGGGVDPIISGSGDTVVGGDFGTAVLIENASHVELANLKITNDRTRPREGVEAETSYGIHVLNTSGSVLTNFRFRNLTLSNILPIEAATFNENRSSGIAFESQRAEGNPLARIDDVIVENCFFYRTGKAGISGGNAGDTDPTNDRRGRNSNFIIRNNRSFQTGGSFYIAARVYNVLVENNDIQFTGAAPVARMANRGSGMWFFSTRNAVAQHNTVLHTHGEGDSYGIHIDYSNKHTLVQYNYTQGAHGGFVEILGDNDFATYRYNISVNDGRRAKSGNTLWFSDYAGSRSVPSSNIYVYNNTVYIYKDAQGQTLTPGVELAEAASAHVYNNAIMVAGSSTLGVKVYRPGPTVRLDNNLLFAGPDATIAPAFIAADAHVIQGFPLYLSPQAEVPGGYKLRAKSAALGAARAVSEPAGILPEAGQGIFAGLTARARRDYFGNPVDLTRPGAHVGAYNGAPVDPSAADELVTDVSLANKDVTLTSPGTQVDLLAAQMVLRGPNRPITRYALVSGNTGDTFYIDEWTGAIRNRKVLTPGTQFTLSVRATFVQTQDVALTSFVNDTRTATAVVRVR